MQKEGGDKKSETDYAQKWQASSSRCLSYLWNKGLPHRETLGIQNTPQMFVPLVLKQSRIRGVKMRYSVLRSSLYSQALSPMRGGIQGEG